MPLVLRIHITVTMMLSSSFIYSNLVVLVFSRHLQTWAFTLQDASITTLGPDPDTVNRLNGESFQQSPLTSLNGFQYGVLWVPSPSNTSIRHVTVARRSLEVASSSWETFTLIDYNQTDDDGHDVITIGVSRGDGTIHLSFDQHDNDLNYRISKTGVALIPNDVSWTPEIFSSPITDYLPGLESLDKSTYYINITYPRFINIPDNAANSQGADLLLEMRVGRSGLGDDWLYKYAPYHGWTLIGRYLEGVNNNAYINGLDFDADGALHTTWTYRDYVNDTGQDVAVEAGPNGPENNHDMDYGFSTDLGETWKNTWGQTISNATGAEPILPISAGITVFSIPKYGGILNQEAQTVDDKGRVHVLNRENGTGVEQWYHYWRSSTATWTRTALPLHLNSANNITNTPTVIGKRGKLVSVPIVESNVDSSIIFAILPSNAVNSTAWSILSTSAASNFGDWKVVREWADGCAWEPLYDITRVKDGVLSLYMVDKPGGDVYVLDLAMNSD